MKYPRVLFDVEVQNDFFCPGGSCYKPAATEAARNVRRLFAWARAEKIPVMSIVLRQREGRRGPLAAVPHCIENTNGEKRPNGTVLRNYIDLGMRGSTDLPGDIFSHYQHVIFERRLTDIFQHPRAERLLTEIQVDTFIVCGAGSARGIVEAVIGLRQRNFKVILAADAILDLDDPRAEMAWLRMLAKSAVPLSTAEVIAGAQAPAEPGRLAKAQAGKAALFRPAESPAGKAMST